MIRFRIQKNRQFQHRHGIGSALEWLQNNEWKFHNFARRTFFAQQDIQFMQEWALRNPIQMKMIIKDYDTPNEHKIQHILKLIELDKSKICVIVGGRGTGKTALGFYIPERLREISNKQIYYLGRGSEALPKWCKTADALHEVPTNTFIIVDESVLQFFNRDFTKESHKLMSKQLTTARHEGKTIFFITINPAMIDINILRTADIVFWKAQSGYSSNFTREGNQREEEYWAKVRRFLLPYEKDETLFEMPKQKVFRKFSNPLPKCWSEDLSKTWKDWGREQMKIQREKSTQELINERTTKLK